VPVHPWSTATIARSRSLELFCSQLARFVVASDFVSQLLAFLQVPHPSAFDSGDVYEHILAAVVGLDEAETLGGIEPFNCAGGHEKPSFGYTCRSPTRCTASSERFRKGEFIRAAPKRENNNDRPSNLEKIAYLSQIEMSTKARLWPFLCAQILVFTSEDFILF
jgi:hypothetical protein